jgi:glutathione S-transferase
VDGSSGLAPGGPLGVTMLTLYQFQTSPFCEKVRRMLAFKGVDFRTVEVERAKIAELQAISPHGKLPAIEHAGRAVWDSTLIAYYLDETFAGPRLVPADPQAAALVHVFEDWADESLYFYEVTMRLAWPHNLDAVLPDFAVGLPGLPLETIRARVLEAAQAGVRAQGLGRKTNAEIAEDAARHFRALNRLLERGGWLVGDQPTLADIAVGAQVGALLDAQEVEPLFAAAPQVQDWMARLDAVAPA